MSKQLQLLPTPNPYYNLICDILNNMTEFTKLDIFAIIVLILFTTFFIKLRISI